MIRTSSLAGLIFVALASAGAARAAIPAPGGVPAGYVFTHHGWFHPSCVVRVGEDEAVGSDLVIRGATASRGRPSAPAAIRVTIAPGARFAGAGGTATAPVHAAPLPAAAIYDGYIVYYEYTGNLAVGPALTTDWIVPLPPPSIANQDIAFFNDILTSADGGDILQPVLDFNGETAGKWSIESEHCCIGGNDMQTTPIVVAPGDTIRGIVTGASCTASGCQSWTVTTTDVTSGKSTTLNTTAPGGVPNGVSPGSLETYGVTSCDMFPASGETTFTGNTLTDANGAVQSPKYTLLTLQGVNAEVPAQLRLRRDGLGRRLHVDLRHGPRRRRDGRGQRGDVHRVQLRGRARTRYTDRMGVRDRHAGAGPAQSARAPSLIVAVASVMLAASPALAGQSPRPRPLAEPADRDAVARAHRLPRVRRRRGERRRSRRGRRVARPRRALDRHPADGIPVRAHVYERLRQGHRTGRLEVRAPGAQGPGRRGSPDRVSGQRRASGDADGAGRTVARGEAGLAVEPARAGAPVAAGRRARGGGGGRVPDRDPSRRAAAGRVDAGRGAVREPLVRIGDRDRPLRAGQRCRRAARGERERDEQPGEPGPVGAGHRSMIGRLLARAVFLFQNS